MSRVLVIGATGLVGQEIVKFLEASQRVNKINVLVRRPYFSKIQNSKIQEYVLDFDHLDPNLECFEVDAVFCAIGTTIKKAGSQEAFRKVDYEYPLKIANLCKSQGARGFYLVSAMGADAHSNFFYNRVKGDLENALEKLGFESLVIARPSVLLGERKESRPWEKISQKIATLFPKKWRSVPVIQVAKSLVSSYEYSTRGKRIIENDQIL